LLVGLCLQSEANIDLDFGKMYRILPDRKAKQDGMVRIVDESGEDYLYPASYFRMLRLPSAIAERLTLYR